MKEKIEFVTEGTIKGRKEIAKINEYVNNFNFDCEFKRKIEQIPETWEELKELCENIKCCNVGVNYIKISKRNMSFLNDGQIRCNYYNMMNKVTPQQMWEIIKNLIGDKKC